MSLAVRSLRVSRLSSGPESTSWMKALPCNIFVLTLRCDHRCHYCQVTPQRVGAVGYDMDGAIASAALDRVFECDAEVLTLEFQGGESALAFDLLQQIVEDAEARALQANRRLRFVMATTLHRMTDEMLAFCRDHRIELSTSLDGPKHVHDACRPNVARDSFDRTVEGIARARAVCGHDRVAALTTVTKRSLPFAREIVDTYVELGFDSIALRPLSPYGFAVRSQRKIGCTVEEYLRFYREALHLPHCGQPCGARNRGVVCDTAPYEDSYAFPNQVC